MRITNTMMTNTTMRNVNKSKNNLYTTEQQMSSQKKISKPSDDPIIAIRALSLRTSLTEVEQYLKKNVPDAGAWLTLTETSLNNMDGIYKDIIKYCTQGSTDSYETTNRSAIIQSIQQLRDAMYAEGNADSSGRYIFTGYRTDRALTFQNDAEVAGLSYRIKQSFKGSDFTTTKYMKNGVDINKIASIKASDTPETQEVYRIRLAYGGCAYDAADAASLPQITVDGQAYAGTIQAVSTPELEAIMTAGNLADNTAYYVYDKGELVFSKASQQALGNSQIDVSYRKDSFAKGDIRPEHYFDCEDLTNGQVYSMSSKTGDDSQDIEYTINFSQNLKVNSRATDVLSYNIGRDLDDLVNSLSSVMNIEEKISRLKDMKNSDMYAGQTDELESMIEAANKELDYAKNNMEALFAKGITQMKGYQSTVNTELSDVGSREVRLTLTKTRLTQQQTTFKDLKSKNEDVELEDIAVDFAAAETVYNAAIATASKTVRQSLLDYL